MPYQPKPTRIAVLLVVAVALLALPAAAKKKQKVRVQAFRAQTTFSFTNTGGQPAHGLHIVFSSKAVPVTDPRTGFAGPFRDIRGSASDHMKLANPKDAIASDGAEIALSFRSEKKKLRVTSWWWTDRGGKRIGDKKSGKDTQ